VVIVSGAFLAMLFGHSQTGPFEPQPILYQIIASPHHFLADITFKLILSFRSTPTPALPPITVVCVSDTHTHTYPIPPGDLLLHAGDMTNAGTLGDLQTQIDWLASLPHEHKVVIAGNHDTYLDSRSRPTLSEKDRTGQLEWHGIRYLQHSSARLRFKAHDNRVLNVYGAPQIPACGGDEFAFQYSRGLDAWSDTVPSDTDILVTHTPPKYHLDLQSALGCEWLLKEVWRVKPRLHVFGHVHAGAGQEVAHWDATQEMYECQRVRPRRGFVQALLDMSAWLGLLQLWLVGIRGILWDRIWGGEDRRTVWINSALMYRDTGKLSNRVQVVLI